jgi:predicted deacylase
MKEAMKIGDVVAKPGTRERGFIKVTIRPDGSPLNIAVLIANGIGEGPTLVLASGLHGCEYEGGEAMRQVWRNLDLQQLRGTLICVPAVNVPAFEVGAWASPIDNLILNKVFPGREKGSLTEKIAYAFWNEVVAQASHLLDFHAGGQDKVIAPFIAYRAMRDDEALRTEEVEEFAKATGIDLLWKHRGDAKGLVTFEALKKGVPALIVEVGGGMHCQEEFVELNKKVIYNVMKFLNMMDSDPEVPDKWTVVDGVHTNCQTAGLFQPVVKLREHVTRGSIIGYVTDLFGEVIESIEAPYDGIVCQIRTFPVVQAGENVVQVGEIIEIIS